MKKLNLSILILFLLFVACRKDSDVFIPYDNPTPASEYIIGSVGGVITDENGNTLSNISVKLETKNSVAETVADENGIFFFRNVEINAERTYLQIDAEGFLPSSRAFIPRESGTEFLNLQLMSATGSMFFFNGQNGIVDVMGGGLLSLPENGAMDANGNVVGDTINFAGRFLNPVLENAAARMPGNLSAISTDGSSKVLATYGMMVIAFSDLNGSPLNIATDKKATLEFPVPNTLIDNAPAVIPLWSFDEEMGLWIEEGQAQLSGSVYVGEVSHTGFWNVAVAYDPVRVEGSLSIASLSSKLKNTFTKITVVDNGISIMENTDNEGKLDGKVPMGQVLMLEAFDACGELMHNAEIGPFFEDVDVGEILIESSNSNYIQLNGGLTCNGTPVTEGYVIIDLGESTQIYFVDEQGIFSGSFNNCFGNGFQMAGFDLTTGEQSENTYYEEEELIEAGSLNVCN